VKCVDLLLLELEQLWTELQAYPTQCLPQRSKLFLQQLLVVNVSYARDRALAWRGYQQRRECSSLSAIPSSCDGERDRSWQVASSRPTENQVKAVDQYSKSKIVCGIAR